MLGAGLLREAAGLLALGLQPGDNMATKAIGGYRVLRRETYAADHRLGGHA